jgi:hypothetical protein
MFSRPIPIGWLPVQDRLSAQLALRRARAQIWFRSPGRQPIYSLSAGIEEIYGHFIATEAHSTLERIGYNLFPPARADELFEISGGEADARNVLESLLLEGGGFMRGDRWGLEDMLRSTGVELVSRPEMYLHLRWRPADPSRPSRRRHRRAQPTKVQDEFWINPLEGRGLTMRPDGSWTVRPALAHGWFQPGIHPPDEYVADVGSIRVVRRPSTAGATPGPCALREYLKLAVAREQTLAVSSATANPEDSSLRAQFARIRWAMDSEPERIVRARIVDRLGGSLLEDDVFGVNPALTQQFLALQHKTAILRIIAMRDHLVAVLGQWLVDSILSHFELPLGPRLVTIGATTAEGVEDAYAEFMAGTIDLYTLLRRTEWQTPRTTGLYETVVESEKASGPGPAAAQDASDRE